MNARQSGSDSGLNAADFLELSRPSQRAWHHLAAGPPVTNPAEIFAATDPLDFTRRAWLGLHDPRWTHELRQGLAVSFLDALERSRHEPLAFARAVIEGARQRSLLRLKPTLMTAACKLVWTTPLECLGRDHHRALKVLAAVYQAEEQWDCGLLDAAKKSWNRFEDMMPKGFFDLRSRISEIRSTILWQSGWSSLAEFELRRAEDWAREAAVSPGRRAEILLRQAKLRRDRRWFRGALEHLERARHLAETDGRDARLRLEILHEQLHALVVLHRHEEAEAVLIPHGELLASAVSDDLLRAETAWLKGRLCFEQGHFATACESLEQGRARSGRFRTVPIGGQGPRRNAARGAAVRGDADPAAQWAGIGILATQATWSWWPAGSHRAVTPPRGRSAGVSGRRRCGRRPCGRLSA